MGPLAAEKGVDFNGLAGDRYADLIVRSREGRPALDRLLIELRLRIVLVRIVDHEEPIVMARKALQAFDDLAKISGEDRVARHCGLPRRIQRPSGAGEMRRAANAAGARRDDEPG